MPNKKRKTRVTKAEVRQLREDNKKKVKGRKNKIVPGPFTDIDPGFVVKANIRWGNSFLGEKLRGTFPYDEMWSEKSWYPIIINITSKNIQDDINEHGIDNYMAACERSLNDSDSNEKDHGHIVLLEASVDGSQREQEDRRFISCMAKTNRKTIVGFAAHRTPPGGGKKKYIVLGSENDISRS